MAGEDEVRPVVRDRSLPPPNPARAYRILLAGGELVLRIWMVSLLCGCTAIGILGVNLFIFPVAKRAPFELCLSEVTRSWIRMASYLRH